MDSHPGPGSDKVAEYRTPRPVPTSHSLIALSSLPEASVFPSGLKATLVTESVWPARVRSSWLRDDHVLSLFCPTGGRME